MGQGGGLQLMNGTKYDWVQSAVDPGSMNSWPFPQVVPGGRSQILYIEWPSSGAPGATVTYTLVGTGSSFMLQTAADGSLDLQVVPNGLVPLTGQIDVGFVHDGDVYFILGGEAGQFSASTLPTAWMQDNLPMLRDLALRHLCISGSHDSGMSFVNRSTAFANACNTVTQTVGILGQLIAGARYFDIRAVVGNGDQLLTGHYTETGIFGMQRANGQSIESIVADVNQFTAQNAELIVLYLSGGFETDEDYGLLGQEDWDRIFDALSQITSLYVGPGTNTDLTKLTVADYIGNGQAAVVVIVDPLVGPSSPPISLDKYAGQGFYPAASFPNYNNYADTDDPQTMMANQYTALAMQRTTPDSIYFILSWTLTQSSDDAVACVTSSAPTSLLDMAQDVNPQLPPTLLSHCTNQSYPNVLYTDAMVKNTTACAMFVNCFTAYPRHVRSAPPLACTGTSGGLTVFYRTPDSQLWMASAPAGTNWGLPAELPASVNSTFTPAAASINGIPWVLYGSVNETLSVASSQNQWSPVQLPGAITTNSVPALAVLGNELCALYLSSAGDGSMWMSQSSDGKNWNGPNQLPGAMTSNFSPALTMMNDTLYVLYRSTADDTLWFNWSSDGDNWNGLIHLPENLTTFWSPALAGLAGTLYAIFMSSTDQSIVSASSTDGGNTWSGPKPLPSSVATLQTPAVAVWNGAIYVIYTSAADGSCWQTSSTDGSHWTQPGQLPPVIVAS